MLIKASLLQFALQLAIGPSTAPKIRGARPPIGTLAWVNTCCRLAARQPWEPQKSDAAAGAAKELLVDDSCAVAHR